MAAATQDQVGNGLRRWLMPALAAAALALAVFLVARTLRRYSLDEVVASIRAMPADRIVLAAGFAAASYFCLTLFDTLAVRHAAGRVLPYRCTALASFTALSLGHTIGLAALSSGTIRFRFYSRWGLTAGQIATVIVFCAATVILGLATLAGAALLIDPRAALLLGLDVPPTRAIGAACFGVPALYLALAAGLRRPFRLAGWRVRLPRPRLALAQIAIGATNFAMVAACLHQVLSAATDQPYLAVASVYVIANVAAIISHVPGGLGVIEGVVLFLMPEASLIGPLLVFRFVYYLVPLALGTALFAATEIAARGRISRAA